jgi:hypothetical protein
MQHRAAELERLLKAVPAAKGCYVRAKGKSLYVGRTEVVAPGEEIDDDRLKLDSVSGTGRFHVRVKLANGRWEATHIGGTLPDLAQAMGREFQHCLVAW